MIDLGQIGSGPSSILEIGEEKGDGNKSDPLRMPEVQAAMDAQDKMSAHLEKTRGACVGKEREVCVCVCVCVWVVKSARIALCYARAVF